jgi:hypothetical protein
MLTCAGAPVAALLPQALWPEAEGKPRCFTAPQCTWGVANIRTIQNFIAVNAEID